MKFWVIFIFCGSINLYALGGTDPVGTWEACTKGSEGWIKTSIEFTGDKKLLERRTFMTGATDCKEGEVSYEETSMWNSSIEEDKNLEWDKMIGVEVLKQTLISYKVVVKSPTAAKKFTKNKICNLTEWNVNKEYDCIGTGLGSKNKGELKDSMIKIENDQLTLRGIGYSGSISLKKVK